MIYSVYLNPTIDKTLYFDNFVIGGTNRPVKSVTVGAGKAVNVSVVLSELGEISTCFGYLYKSDASIIKDRLSAYGVISCFDEYIGSSRVNTKIFDLNNRITTELNESGPVISHYDLDSVVNKLLSLPISGDTVILTGSLPNGANDDIYSDIILELKRKDVFCVLDTSGKALIKGVKSKPDLIKPNEQEFFELTGKRYNNYSDLPGILIDFSKKNDIKYICLTLGENGAFLCDSASVYYANPVKVNILSTVGAGDSMVAGIIHGLASGTEHALRCGVAAATASLMKEGTELMLRKDYEKIINSVVVEQVL